jgi:hypothetical protein
MISGKDQGFKLQQHSSSSFKHQSSKQHSTSMANSRIFIIFMITAIDQNIHEKILCILIITASIIIFNKQNSKQASFKSMAWEWFMQHQMTTKQARSCEFFWAEQEGFWNSRASCSQHQQTNIQTSITQ